VELAETLEFRHFAEFLSSDLRIAQCARTA